MCGGFRSCAEQQKDHRHHLVAADTAAFFLNADKLGDQAFATVLARGLQALFQVGSHRGKASHHAPETDERASDARDGAGPGQEFRPVGGGRPSNSQMTESGSFRAYRSTRSAGLPSANSSPASSSAIAKMRGSISRIARRRKASSTIPRNRVWSGSSIVSMLLASVRTMPGIHQRKPGKAAAVLAQSERLAVFQHAAGQPRKSS